MGQPVKLSDELVNEARVAGAAMRRSIAGQVEFWASLGRAMERMMSGSLAADLLQRSAAKSLSERIESVDSPVGRARLEAYLDSKPFPRFRADPVKADVFIREEADGTRTVGRMRGREFVPEAGSAEVAS